MSTYCLYDSGPCFKDMLDKDKSASMREKKFAGTRNRNVEGIKQFVFFFKKRGNNVYNLRSQVRGAH